MFFNSRTMTWSFKLETDEYLASVEIGKGKKEKIVLEPIGSLENETEIRGRWKEEIKHSKEWNEYMERMKQWEEKMRNQLKLENIQWIAKEVYQEKELHLFGFEITSPISNGSFSLEETEEYEMDIFSTYNKGIYFFLVLEKVKNEKGISFALNEEYPIQRDYFSENQMYFYSSIQSEFKKTPYSILYDFYTHQSFLEDVVDIISNEPKIRLKKLFG